MGNFFKPLQDFSEEKIQIVINSKFHKLLEKLMEVYS